MKRVYEIWIGEQTSGKTFQLRNAIKSLSTRKSIDCIFICDRLGEFGDLPRCEIVRDWSDMSRFDELPRIISFQFGPDAEAYNIVFREAIEQGNVCIVLDEGYEFAPGGASWRGAQELKAIMFSGRHLRNIAGKLCPIHLIVAAQYPKSIYHQFWGQANCVMCGVISGENTRNWIKGNFGEVQLKAVDMLNKWEWFPLRGRPACPPLRPPR